MKSSITFVLILLTLTQTVSCQSAKPSLNANSQVISVKEGDYLFKNSWGASSEVKLDTYVSNKFTGTREITFYSDIDSLTIKAEPNKAYDFVILLNGKDKAHTQIRTYVNEEPTNKVFDYYRKDGLENTTSDTLQFTLGEKNRIHLKGKINNSEPVDFIFDTGAGTNVVRTATIGDKVNLKIDGITQNNGADGVTTKEKSSGNTFEIENLIWEDARVVSIDYKKPSFDAVLGWGAFKFKVLEIDYENKIMVSHKNLKIPNEYAKLPMQMNGGTPYIEVSLFTDGKESKSWFSVDTGFNKSVLVSEKFTKENGLLNNAEILKTSTYQGSAGIPRKKLDILLSKIKIGPYEIYHFPISITDKDPEGVEDNDYLGGELLKRFNVILDFKNNFIYFKPNRLIHLPFED